MAIEIPEPQEINGAHPWSVDREDSIANYANGLGDPERDTTEHARPTISDRLKPRELDYLYLGNDVAGIIVDEMVEESLRNGWTVTDENNEEIELEDLSVGPTIRQAAINGRLYGGGLVLMVPDGNPDPEKPVGPESSQGVTNLITLDRYEARPVNWQSDITEPNFGEPEYYEITPHTPSGSGTTRTVHRSRLLRFGGRKLPRRISRANGGWDDSVLQRVWGAIRRFYQTEKAITNIVEDFETSTLSIAGLSELMSDEEGRDMVERRVELMHKTSDLIQTVLLDADAGEQFNKQASSVSGLDKVWQRLALSVAKAARMPMTVLFGQTPSGLNTDGASSQQNWHKRVHSYQEDELGPALQRLYSLARPGQELTIEFDPLKELSQTEKAKIRLQTAKTDKIYNQIGSRSADQIARSRDSKDGWSMETEPREDLQEDKDFGDMQALQEQVAQSGQGQAPGTGGEGRTDARGAASEATAYSGWRDPNLPAAVRQLPPNPIKKWVDTYNRVLADNPDAPDSERIARAHSRAWSAIKDTDNE